MNTLHRDLGALVLNGAKPTPTPAPRTKPPLELIVARLRRLESRIKHITIVCDEHIATHGGEPSTITRIHQIATGEYDT